MAPQLQEAQLTALATAWKGTGAFTPTATLNLGKSKVECGF
jgi:hypothetical protein